MRLCTHVLMYFETNLMKLDMTMIQRLQSIVASIGIPRAWKAGMMENFPGSPHAVLFQGRQENKVDPKSFTDGLYAV